MDTIEQGIDTVGEQRMLGIAFVLYLWAPLTEYVHLVEGAVQACQVLRQAPALAAAYPHNDNAECRYIQQEHDSHRRDDSVCPCRRGQAGRMRRRCHRGGER